MAHRTPGRVLETSTTTGTAPYVLLGGVAGARAMSAAGITNGDTVEYYSEDVDASGNPTNNGWEEGLGTWSTGGNLTRTLIYDSSNAGAAVNWSAGTRRIGIGLVGQTMGQLKMLASIPFFGDSSDGDVTISSGTTTLTRSMCYRNLTISGTGSIDPAGYTIYVSGTLDLTNAPAGAISRNGGDGGNAANNVAGAAGATSGTSARIGLGQAGTIGSAGSSANTGVAGGVGNLVIANGGPAGLGGSGADGSNGVGGTSTTPSTVSSTIERSLYNFGAQPNAVAGAAGLKGGAGGGNSGSNQAGGSGGSGAGGGGIDLRARTINRGASTAASCIRAKGGRGGNGGTPNASGAGAGGGSGGGGGGFVSIVYERLIGTAATNAIDVGGGDGGNGGNDTVSSIRSGFGGEGGYGGRVLLFNVLTGIYTQTDGVANSRTAPVAPSGATGGVGGVGSVCKVNL